MILDIVSCFIFVLFLTVIAIGLIDTGQGN
jgi:hypothetical protein